VPHPTRRFHVATLASLVTLGCEKPPEPVPEDPCPQVAMDKLAGDWIKVNGTKGDPNNRFRIKGTPGDYRMILIPGSQSRIPMVGEQREDFYVFDEQLAGTALQQFQDGQRQKNRIRVTPHHNSCSLHVGAALVELGSDGKEKVIPRTRGDDEYLTFPEDVELTFEIPTGFLFLGEAARSRRLEEAQLREFEGYPKPDIGFGEAIPVGVYTDAAADGPSGCTYDMDLFFDSRSYTGRRDSPSKAAGERVPAGAVEDGYRHWYVPAWFAPFSGYHLFEMHRYRTCSGTRELIEINGIEAMLM